MCSWEERERERAGESERGARRSANISSGILHESQSIIFFFLHHFLYAVEPLELHGLGGSELYAGREVMKSQHQKK